MTAPGVLPDPHSGIPVTELECQLLADAGVNLDYRPPRDRSDPIRALRAGHAAGRASVLDAPARVYRIGDPEPEAGTALLDGDGAVEHWDPAIHHDWLDYVRCYGPLVEVRLDFDAALAADETRRAES